MTTSKILHLPKQLSLIILITVTTSAALCPSGRSKRIFGHLGFIRADEGYDVDDICEWKIYAPLEKRNYSISIVFSRIACDRNLLIEGEELCRYKPRASRIYIPDTCKQTCEAPNCREFKEYPLVVTYGRHAVDRGFVIRFSYEPCVVGEEGFKNETTSPMQSFAIIRGTLGNNRSVFKVTTMENMLEKTSIRESTTPVFNSTRNASDTDFVTIAIASSIAVAVVVVIVAIAIFKNTRAEEPEVAQDHVTYITNVQCSTEREFEPAKSSLYETIETDTATNQAYSNEPPDKDITRADSEKDTGHIYEEVTPDDRAIGPSKSNHQYDEFAPDSDSFQDDSSENDNEH